jgi:hypothetical protein
MDWDAWASEVRFYSFDRETMGYDFLKKCQLEYANFPHSCLTHAYHIFYSIVLSWTTPGVLEQCREQMGTLKKKNKNC